MSSRIKDHEANDVAHGRARRDLPLGRQLAGEFPDDLAQAYLEFFREQG
jgi:hypothetical protein